MTTQRNRWRELDGLLERLCEDTLSPKQAGRLESLVDGNREAQRRYLSYLYLDGSLRWEKAVGATAAAVVEHAGEHVGEKDARPKDVPSGKSPILGFLSDSFQQGIDLLSNPTRFSVLVAAMAIGSLLTLLAFWAAPLYRSIEKQWGQAPEPVYVARLTGQRDCVWEKDTIGPAPDSHLALGRKLELASGLIEITFDRGARVVVEGPATLGVISAAGLSMDLGQLRALVPARAVGFQVTTPTVTITDLGTEFGLRVDRGGQSEVHVFNGQVEAELVLAGQKASQPLKLTANQAARFYPGWDQAGTIAFDRRVFSRLAPIGPPPKSGSYAEVILADRPIGYWRLDETDPTQPAVDLSSNKNDGAYSGGVTLGQTSAWPALGTAAKFDGTGLVIARADGTEYQMGNNFTLETWVKVGNGDETRRRFIRSGDWGFGYDIERLEGGSYRTGFIFTTFRVKDYYFDETVSLNTWVYAAVTLDGSNDATLYINGQPVQKVAHGSPGKTTNTMITIGGDWLGGIDEVAIYNGALDGATIRAHFRAGVASRPTAKPNGREPAADAVLPRAAQNAPTSLQHEE